MEINIQSVTPSKTGFAPTDFIAPTDSELPIKKSVTESILCEATDILRKTGSGIVK